MRLLFVSVVVCTLAIASCTTRETISNKPAAISGKGDNAPNPQSAPQPPCLNLNIATAGELIKLPGIGDVMAKRIIDYRERHGRLRRPEEIIIIEGFSDRKYRTIESLICVE